VTDAMTRMPAVFLGHGNPMNALEHNMYTDAWHELGASLPRPRAVLAISAHWYTRGVGVTAMAEPRTIHDFSGFPPELFAVEYPAPGDPGFAWQVTGLLGDTAASVPIALDDSWGIDHGTWSLLVHLYPEADVPVVQLSIDGTRDPDWHWDLASRLAPLRDDDVLVLGSGNIVHNLGRIAWGSTAPADWNVRFDEHIRDALEAGDRHALTHYLEHPDGAVACPSPDHYLPVLYVAALRQEREAISTVVSGYDVGSLSMRSFRVG
jgi:4,5-DOPA dioxygenase extradiol